jgi:predicted amidophosphoribosyltransferase
MKCPNCRKWIPDSGKFCQSCGAEIEVRAKVRQSEEKEGSDSGRIIGAALLILGILMAFGFIRCN